MVSLKFVKKIDEIKLFIVVLIFILIAAGIVVAQVEASYSSYRPSISSGYQVIGTSINTQYYNPSLSSASSYLSPNVYWPEFDSKVCKERQDFIVQIAPGGCTPAVVRSDLLEEQDVPVFCKLMLIQANPLIDVSRVKSITFPGKHPDGVSGISYFPSRVNLIDRRRNLADTPIDDNIGYFVVSLKRQKSEKEMHDWVGGNLTAIIDYDIEGALGIGKPYFYVSELSNEDWLRNYKQYSFWNGKGYIKTESVESDRVTVSIYRDMDSRISTVTLKKGETAETIYLPGFYCAAGLKVKVEDIIVPVEAALLQIDDQQTWVAKGDKIVGGCSVMEVDAYSGGGKVSISCPVGKFDLKLSPGKVTLNVSSLGEKDYSIGKEIKNSTESTGIYLGYVGTWTENNKKTKFAVLVSEPWSTNQVEFADKNVYSAVEKVINDENNGKLNWDNLEKAIKISISNEYTRIIKESEINKNYEVKLIKEGDKEAPIYRYVKNGTKIDKKEAYSIKLSEVKVIENQNWEQETGDKKLAYDYYKEAIKNYKDLADFYPNEKRIEEEYFEPYSAEGLYNAAELAGIFNMKEDEEEFLSRLFRNYPDSAWTRKAENLKDRLLKYDSSESKAVVNLKEGSYFVELLDFKKPDKKDLSADLIIGGSLKNLEKDEIYPIDDKKSVQVTEIEDNYISIQYSKTKEVAATDVKTVRLDLDKNRQTDFDGTRVKLENINLKKQAKILLDSEVKGPRAFANFSFKIGIEKRGIKLSPEKTQEMIDNLEKTIKQWESINEKLGKVVKGLKGACFATSAVLTVKNLFAGVGGKSMARKEVMTRVGGWNDYCERIVSSGEAASVQKCLLDHNSDIEKDIEIYAKYIEETNKKLETARQGLVEKTDFLDIEGQVKDRITMEQSYRSSVSSECEAARQSLKLYDNFCKEGNLEDIKNIVTWYKTSNDAGLSRVYSNALKNESAITARYIQTNYNDEAARKKAEEEAKSYNLGLRTLTPAGDTTTYGEVKQITHGDSAHSVYKNFEVGDYVVRAYIPSSKTIGNSVYTALPEVAGKEVIVQVKKDEKGIYTIGDRIYHVDGMEIKSTGKDTDETGKAISAWGSVKEYMGRAGLDRIRQSDAKAYENKMSNPDKLQVKYFDRAPYKGLPAEVPFDVENGWYVEMEYVLSGFGKPYDESGRVVNFYICNVGPNGLIEFKRKNDDICRYYNGVSDDLEFPGLDISHSRQLVSRARNAIAEASRYYGKKEAIINGRKFWTGISFGGEAGRCSDFMSPRDCYLMFNVCDPVICPSSRCNLGGDFYVDNVVQTGIIGSIVLCLPNIKEGIMIPVCLTGVHAGIEGYLSILKAEKGCLNESLTTGRNIGICDEITSIYTCEFFWKQLVPFFNVLVPKLIESFYSQGTRGGGEYLTVQAAWDNTQSAIDYFKNDYAVNSMKAFSLRSTEEAGTEVCKSFISARYPTNFDLLTEPDSPVQYSAWFDENVLTTATPYPTSHYKVYYHIYAGKDQGAYYVVYLKDISEEFTSFYTYTPEHYVVDRNYIAKGSYVDNAKDFTAPSGYKQLCININGQDECDFGKVSTSFAVDYLSDKYAEEQAEQTDIKTSKACVAGTPSVLSMAQPNLQAGAEEVVQPELYNQGIVRVCATYNPGKQVSSTGEYDTTNSTYDRWKQVGYCDDPTIKCWLDTDSVKDVIKNKNIETGVLQEVDISVIGEGYLTPEESRAIANKADKLLRGETIGGIDINAEITDKTKASIEAKFKTIIDELNKLAYYGPSNSNRARGLFLLGRLYGEIAKKVKGVDAPKTPNSAENTGIGGIGGENIETRLCTGAEFGGQTEPSELKRNGTKVESKDKAIWERKGDNLWESIEQGKVSWDRISKPASLCKSGEPATTPTPTPTPIPTPTATEWTDDMLRDNVLIKAVTPRYYYLLRDKVNYYKYDFSKIGDKWTSNNDKFNTKLGYVEGIKELVNEVYKDKGYIEVGDLSVYSTNSKSADDMLEKVLNIIKTTTPTTPTTETPVATATSTTVEESDFTLNEGRIFYKGENLKLFLEGINNGLYGIKPEINNLNGEYIGYVFIDAKEIQIRGEITDPNILLLEQYYYDDSTKKFIKKNSGSSS